MRQQDVGILSSPLSQGSDRDETPLSVRFSHLGNIVGQHWSPKGLYTHFLWHHVAEMMIRATKWYHNVWCEDPRL